MKEKKALLFLRASDLGENEEMNDFSQDLTCSLGAPSSSSSSQNCLRRISGLSETHIIDVVLLSIQGSNKSIEKDDTILLKCCIYTYSTSSNSYAKSACE